MSNMNIFQELVDRVKSPLPPFWSAVRWVFLIIAMLAIIAQGVFVYYGMDELNPIAERFIELSLFGALLATLTKQNNEPEKKDEEVI